MLKNYFTIGIRNLLKNKTFSIINIMGLSMGLTCFVLIMLWVQNEYGIDSFHKNKDRLYIVTSKEFMQGEVLGGYNTPGLLGEELPKVLPDVEMSCNYAWDSYMVLATPEKKVKRKGNYAGPDFFKMFSYPLIEGTTSSALNNPEDIAISRKLANQFFGSPQASMGKTLTFENYKELKVSAVFEDIGNESSEKFEYLLSWDLFSERESWMENWHNSGPITFVLLKKDAKIANLQTNIREFIARYDKEYKENDRLELDLQPYGEKYLHSTFKDGQIKGGRIEYVRLFGFVGLFILLIGCINFMNLSTAQSLKRAKEIGVRKIIGADRSALIKQFLGESFIYSILAAIISIFLILFLLPAYNQLTGKSLELPFSQLSFWMRLSGLVLIIAFISGSYPALLLSSFKPLSILKNSLKINPASAGFRKGLVVFQFTLCMIFIVSMLVISDQVKYIQHKNLGYQKDNLIYVPLTGNISSNFETFKNEALKISGILSVTKMDQRPVELENATGELTWMGKLPNTYPRFTQVAVGYDFINTIQAELAQGRDFSKAFADSTNYLINETALRSINYDDPIGKPLTFWNVPGTIVGVVKDFHFTTLHKPIEPLIIRLTKNESWGYALIRNIPGKTSDVLAGLEQLHQKMNPDFPFAHQFADEEYAASYTSEMLVQKLSAYFTFIAIFISCLGLLGLALFSAEQRAKEIGIRKVLGASFASLFALLSSDFLKLIVIAILVATPIGWWIMHNWLSSFTYKISIGWEVFAIAGVSAFFIAVMTIFYQTGKAILVNPIKSLRAE